MVPEREHLDGAGRSPSSVVAAYRPALRRSGVRVLATAGSLIALLAVQGCSSTPNWANPMHWYDSTVSAVIGNDGSAAAEDVSDTGTTPNLSTVPARPTIDPASERTKLREGLSADRAAAQYTSQELRAEPEVDSEPAPAAVAAAGVQETTGTSQTAPPAAAVAPRTAVAVSPSAPAPASTPASTSTPVSAPTPVPAPAQAAPAATDNRAVAASAPAAAAPAAATVQQVYQEQLRASAAASTSVPANTTFAASTAKPITQFSAAVPPVVQQAYNASVGVQPRTAPPYRPADRSQSASQQTAFNAAGSRLGATIDYRAGSSTLSAADRDTLRQLVQEYRARGGILRVIGYAGAGDVGTGTNNARPMQQFDIAQARAAGVAKALTKLGAKAQDVFVEARDASGGNGSEAHTAQIFLEN